MANKIVHEFNLNGVPFRLETGEIANHAQSAFMVTYGETVVLITLVVGGYNPDLDFFPLTIDYSEKLYAAGRISSSPYIKREGKPSDGEILSARLIDHAVRSLFPSDFRNETQIIAQVLSYDKEHDPVLASIIGTSFTIAYSGLPFLGPYGATHVGIIDSQIILNPLLSQMEMSSIEMMVSSTEVGIVSVEAEAHDVPEEKVKEGITQAVVLNNALIEEQKVFLKKFGKKAFEYMPAVDKEELNEFYLQVKEKYGKEFEEAVFIKDKMAREHSISLVTEKIKDDYVDHENIVYIKAITEKVLKNIVRKGVIEDSKRPDGRKLDEVRQISARVGVLPRVHGSALFSRGETQSLTIVTLASEREAQQLQDLTGEHEKHYFHHYNMPGYANGEVDRKFGFPNRRSIGHGAIGEKALKNMIPSEQEFPYTIRVVSEITSSNGSTSMAATCGSTLALMDAGVPVKKVVGGIGVGLVYEGETNYKILTDIIGFEDFYGDMDFKITGSNDGITAIQLDNKMAGIPSEILFEAIDRSKKGRQHVISEMEKCLSESRKTTSKYAPKFKQVKIDSEKIGALIGPGGKNIRNITEKTGVDISIDEDNSGNIMIYADSEERFNRALSMISLSTGELTAGNIYKSEVVRVEPYGVFVEIEDSNIQGLVHVTNLGMGYVKDLQEVVKVGQVIEVKYLGRDEKGRLKFAAANQQAQTSDTEKNEIK